MTTGVKEFNYVNIKAARRENLRWLAMQVGGISALANRLGKAPGQLSHVIGINASKNIGDRLAYFVERAFGLPGGWLDRIHTRDEDDVPQSTAHGRMFAVPILQGREVLEWQHTPNKSILKRTPEFIRIPAQIGRHAFALRLESDIMEAPQGISFPAGTLIIADPDKPMRNGSFVVVCIGYDSTPCFRQLVIEGSRRYLKPLNPRYPLYELKNHNYTVCGILQQAIILV